MADVVARDADAVAADVKVVASTIAPCGGTQRIRIAVAGTGPGPVGSGSPLLATVSDRRVSTPAVPVHSPSARTN